MFLHCNMIPFDSYIVTIFSQIGTDDVELAFFYDF